MKRIATRKTLLVTGGISIVIYCLLIPSRMYNRIIALINRVNNSKSEIDITDQETLYSNPETR